MTNKSNENWLNLVAQFEVATLLVGLSMGLVFIISRWGFPIPWTNLIQIFLVLAALIAIPRWSWQLSNKKTANAVIKDKVFAASTLIPILSLGLLGLILPNIVLALVRFGLLGLGVASVSQHFKVKKIRLRNTLPIAIIVIITGAIGWYSGVRVWGVEYQSPLQLEQISIGRAHQDTLFHLAISHIFSKTGVVSTGLHSTQFLPYHAGSHIWLASLGKILNFTIIETYSQAYPIIVLPLLYFSLISSVIFVIKKDIKKKISVWSTIKILALLLIFIVGLLPLSTQSQVGISRIIFFSESYTLANLFLFFSIPTIFLLIKELNHSTFSLTKKVNYLLIVSTWAAFIGYTKVSHLVFIPIMMLFASWKLKKNKVFSLFLTIILILIVWLFVTKFRLPEHSAQISLFHYFLIIVENQWKGWWPLIGFGWVWLTLAVLYRKVHKTSWQSQLLIVLTLFSIVPGLILNLPGASANYFLDLPKWVALFFLMELAISKTLLKIKFNFLSLITISLFVLIPLSFNILSQTLYWHSYNSDIKNHFLRFYGSNSLSEATRHLEQRDIYVDLLSMAESDQNLQVKKLLYIENDDPVWELPYPCQIQPLVISAVSGQTQLFAVPSEKCGRKLFGNSSYQINHKANLSNACNLAKDKLVLFKNGKINTSPCQ